MLKRLISSFLPGKNGPDLWVGLAHKEADCREGSSSESAPFTFAVLAFLLCLLIWCLPVTFDILVLVSDSAKFGFELWHLDARSEYVLASYYSLIELTNVCAVSTDFTAKQSEKKKRYNWENLEIYSCLMFQELFPPSWPWCRDCQSISEDGSPNKFLKDWIVSWEVKTWQAKQMANSAFSSP